MAPFDPDKVYDPRIRSTTVADTKVYLPKQHVRRGVAGYKGKDVVVVDPATRKERTADEDAADNAKVIATKTAKADKD